MQRFVSSTQYIVNAIRGAVDPNSLCVFYAGEMK